MPAKGDGNGPLDPEKHIGSVWEFEDEDQKREMLEPITPEN